MNPHELKICLLLYFDVPQPVTLILQEHFRSYHYSPDKSSSPNHKQISEKKGRGGKKCHDLQTFVQRLRMKIFKIFLYTIRINK